MRLKLLAVLLVTASCGLFPSSADAYWLYWIDDLSGPRFHAVLAEDIRLVCSKQPDTINNDREARALVVGGIFSLCRMKPGERRRASLNLNVSWLAGEDPNVEDHKLIIIEPAFSARASAALEFASGAGMAIFSAKFREGSRIKFLLEPIRVDFRPLYLWRQGLKSQVTTGEGSWFMEAVVIRAGIIGFPTGFEAGFFSPDFVEHEAEFKYHIGTFVDTEPLLRRLFDKWD
jgi:hypothetical protein